MKSSIYKCGLIFLLLISYTFFSQRQYEIRSAGYWSSPALVSEYWIPKTDKLLVAEPIAIEVDKTFKPVLLKRNQGYDYALSAIPDGAKIMSLVLLYNHMFGR